MARRPDTPALGSGPSTASEDFDFEAVYETGTPSFEEDTLKNVEPETPMSKQLRVEAEQRHAASGKAKMPSVNDQDRSSAMLKRPKSNGNDGPPIPFANAPAQPKRCQPTRSAPLPISFAPKHLNKQINSDRARNATSVGPLSNNQSKSAETSHLPKRNDEAQDQVQALTTPHTEFKAATAAYQPKPCRPNLPEDMPRPSVEVAAAPVPMPNDGADQEDSEMKDTDDNAEMHGPEATPDDSGIAVGTQSNYEDPRKRDARSSPCSSTTSTSNQSGTQKDARGGSDQGSRCPSRSSNPTQQIRQSTRSTPSVISPTATRPSKVTKNYSRGVAKQRSGLLPFVPAEEQTPSDDEILMVLMHRRKQMEDNLTKAHAKVKTLQSRNGTLQTQKDDLQTQLQRLSNEHADVSDRHDGLLSDLEAFKAKYHKLKDFAKSLSAGMLHLRDDFDKQGGLLQTLCKERDMTSAALATAKASLTKVEYSHEDQVKKLASTHREMDKSFRTIDGLRNRLSDTTTQLSDEQRRSKRLEAHVIEISGTQHRLNKAIEGDSKTLIQWMERIHVKLGRIDTAVADVEVRDVASECLDAVKELQQSLREKPQSATDEAQAWMGSLSTLQQVVKDNQASIAESIETMGSNISVASVDVVKTSIAEILASIQSLKPDMDATKRTDMMNNQLTGQIQGKEEVISTLQGQLAERNKSIGQTVSMCAELAKQGKEKTMDEEQRQQTLIKYQSASSNYAKAKESLENANQEKIALNDKINELQGKLQQAETDQQRHRVEMQKKQEAATAHHNLLKTDVENRDKEIDKLRNVLKENDNSINNANTEIHRWEQEYAKLQKKHEDLTSEVQQLHQGRADLARQLNDSVAGNTALQDKLADHDSISTQLKTASSEVQRLQPFESQFGDISLELEGLKQSMVDKDGKLASQSTAIQQLQAKADQVPGLSRDMEVLENARAALATRLEHANVQAKLVPDLRKQLESKEKQVANFGSELEKLRPFEQQLIASTAQKDRIAQELLQVNDELAQAQRQLDTNADTDAQLRTMEEQIAQLQQQVAEAAGTATDLANLKQESQLKDSRIMDLTNEVHRLKTESQTFEQVASQIPESLLEPIHQHFSQGSQEIPSSLARELVNSQDLPANLPRHGTTLMADPPQRKVADRSSKARSQRPKPTEVGVGIEETQETEVIPDSQKLETRFLEPMEPPGDRSDSPLTELEYMPDFEDDALAYLEPGVIAQGKATAPAAQIGMSDQPRQGPRPAEVNHARPPSSAMSEDLFSKHADGLGGTQCGSRSAPRYPSSPLQRQTVNPREVLLDPPRSSQGRSHLSPNRLRDGRIHGNRNAPSSQRESTPDQERARPQPNSAAKRSGEDDSQTSLSGVTKKRKRNLDSMREPTTTTPSTQARGSAGERSAARSSRGLVDSDAPTPGRSQRSSRKPGRKGSKHDKYSNRFGEAV